MPTKDIKYVPTIGIECHVQLKTKTKLFAAVGNDAKDAEPNSLISHICVAMPGALPVLNEEAIRLSCRAAFALCTRPQTFSKFDRKHYFYPDLPKGYQITQYDQPIIVGGHVHLQIDGQNKTIDLERANLEEDAGKNTHPSGANYSLVDLNRAGTPLLEIVSQPQLHSAAEAKAYARELYLLMKYAEVTDGDMYHGHVRFDVNVSISQDKAKPGTRTEVKNLNSFRSVEAAVEYEIKRQTEQLQKGHKIIQETRGWDESKQKTIAQREKEEAHDYRYMPEPDVPPVELDKAYIQKIENQMPLLPPQIRQKLAGVNIEPKVIEDILDRPRAVPIILQVLAKGSLEDVRRAAFWLLQPEAGLNIEAGKIIDLSTMVTRGKLSSTAAKSVFSEMGKSKAGPDAIAANLKLLQVSDEAEIEKIVAQVITENPKAADDVKAGEAKAIGFLVGQVMKKSLGKANPGLAQKLIKKKLDI